MPDYPSEDDVRLGVVYANGGMTGNVVLPDADSVFFGTQYGANGNEFTGEFECPSPPPPPISAANPFARINAAIVSRVALALGIGTNFVRPVANDNYAVTETENLFAYIRAYGPSPINPSTGQPFGDDGAGRYRRVIGRRIRIYIYIRSGVDTYGGDEVALGGEDVTQTVATPPTMPGIFVLEEVVINALDDWTPPFVSGLNTYPLTIGPVHFVDSADGPPVRKAENEEGLVRSHIDVQVCYTLAINQAEPAPTDLPVVNPGN